MLTSNKIFSIIVILGALAVGCKKNPSSQITDDAKLSTETTLINYKCGDLDEKGRIVVFALGERYQVLETDAALIFRNIGSESEPKAVYDLTTQLDGHREFTALDELLKALSDLPEPRIVDFYSHCGAQPWYGIADAEVDLFFQCMETARVELRGERPNGFHNIICTCP